MKSLFGALGFAFVLGGGTHAVAAPEITVAGNWSPILDGGAASADNGTNMGVVGISDATPEDNKVFVRIQVFNTGNENLLLDNANPVYFTLGADEDYSVPPSDQFTKTIVPGGVSEFTIVCTPGQAGTRATTCHIISNDSNEADFDFAVTCAAFNSPTPDRSNLTFLPPETPIVKVKETKTGTRYKISGAFTLINDSDKDITIPTQAVLGFSANRFADQADLLAKPKAVKKLAAGATKTIKYKFLTEQALTNATIIGYADNLSGITESSEIDNRQGAVVPIPAP